MRRALSTLTPVGLAVAMCGCVGVQMTGFADLSGLISEWEAPEEHVWGEGCVFDDAKAPDEERSQLNDSEWHFANPWVMAGAVAAAVAVPVAVHHDDDPNDLLLVVDDILRAACLDTCYLADDEEIGQLLSIVAQFLDENVDREEIDLCGVIDAALEPVGRPGFVEELPNPRAACEECQAAIIDYIYSYRWHPGVP